MTLFLTFVGITAILALISDEGFGRDSLKRAPKGQKLSGKKTKFGRTLESSNAPKKLNLSGKRTERSSYVLYDALFLMQ